MNLHHLKYFYVVAQEGGFSKAAKLLRIQQPAISRMVGLLEEDVGFKLFKKVGRNIQLTSQGEEVFASCKRIFGEVENLKHSLGQIRQECKGPLLLAAAEPVVSHFLPTLLKEYKNQHPLVHPQIFSGPASGLIEQIASGELEFGIFFHIPHLPEKLEVFETREVRHRVVVRKDLRKKKEVLESFIGSREIDDTTTRKFPTLDRLKKNLPGTQIKLSSNNLSAHVSYVRQGLGISVLPEFLIQEFLKSGELVDILPQEELFFKMKFIKRRNSLLSLNAQELLRLCFQNHSHP